MGQSAEIKDSFNSILEKVMRLTDLLRDKKEKPDEVYTNSVNSFMLNLSTATAEDAHIPFEQLKWVLEEKSSENAKRRSEKIEMIIKELIDLHDIIFKYSKLDADEEETKSDVFASVIGDFKRACEALKDLLLDSEIEASDDSSRDSLAEEGSPSFEKSNNKLSSLRSSLTHKAQQAKSTVKKVVKDSESNHASRMQRCSVLLGEIEENGDNILGLVIKEVHQQPSSFKISNSATILQVKQNLESENEKLLKVINKLKNTKKENLALITQYWQWIGVLNEKLEFTEQSLTKRTSEVEVLKKQSDEDSSKIAENENVINNLNNQISSLQQQLQSSEAVLQKLSVANNTLQNKEESIGANIIEKLADGASLQQAMFDEKAKMEVERAKHEADMAKLNVEYGLALAEVEKKLATLRSENDAIKAPAYSISSDSKDAKSKFSAALKTLSDLPKDNPELASYVEQMQRAEESNDMEMLDYAAYAMNCVAFQQLNPNQPVKLYVPEKPIGMEQSNQWNKIAGIALMTAAVLVGLASIAMIATLHFAPVGAVGLGFTAKLFALGVTTYGLTLAGSCLGFFAGNELRRMNSGKNMMEQTANVMHSIKKSSASV